MNKHRIETALRLFKASREPVPHEINEIDWKVALSTHKDRLVEHLIAFANHPNGGIFGLWREGFGSEACWCHSV